MKFFLIFSALIIISFPVGFFYKKQIQKKDKALTTKVDLGYWFVLKRKSNIEHLYYGVAGNEGNSKLVNTFTVKTGRSGEAPTPLPQLLGKEYWLITAKEDASDNPETAPYFLTLNIPVNEAEPYGPTPYLECNGQCNWQQSGNFGLHGINGDQSKLSKENTGSLGCIRHRDEDITFLYNILEPAKNDIRYYVDDI